jgi:hypothetical protein
MAPAAGGAGLVGAAIQVTVPTAPLECVPGALTRLCDASWSANELTQGGRSRANSASSEPSRRDWGWWVLGRARFLDEAEAGSDGCFACHRSAEVLLDYAVWLDPEPAPTPDTEPHAYGTRASCHGHRQLRTAARHVVERLLEPAYGCEARATGALSTDLDS